MKQKFLSIAILLILLCVNYQLFAQNNKSVRYFEQGRSEGFLSYSFFVGPDAADFSTSIKGFGSGLIDVLASRNSVDLINVGSDKFYLSLGAGFAILKYRFANNLVFGKSADDEVTWMVDPDTSHNYVNTFFGYGKSKLITTSFYFPLNLNVAVGKNMYLIAGGYMDVNLTARYKMKYLDGDDKVKEIIRSAEFRNFNPNTVKFGVNAALFFKKLGYGLSATYCLSPFFKPGMGPDIHEARISATYSIKNLKEMVKK